MNRYRLAIFCVAAVAAVGVPGAASAQNTLHVGETWELQLEGNPSTGYTWQLDKGASKGLSSLRVKSLGYADTPKRRPVVVGVPAPFAFRIRCSTPGLASLWFEYLGPTGKRARRYNVSVLCS